MITDVNMKIKVPLTLRHQFKTQKSLLIWPFSFNLLFCLVRRCVTVMGTATVIEAGLRPSATNQDSVAVWTVARSSTTVSTNALEPCAPTLTQSKLHSCALKPLFPQSKAQRIENMNLRGVWFVSEVWLR